MNLPNSLSLLRIILVPLMAVLFILNAPVFAVAVFLLAAFTDFLDGYLARKLNKVTDLGKLLDPIADKMLVLFALFLVVEAGVFETYFNLPVGVGAVLAGLIIGRDFLVSLVRQIAASKGVVVHANFYGKIKAVFLYISLPLLMLLEAFYPYNHFAANILPGKVFYYGSQFAENFHKYSALVLFGIAVLLTVISGIIYVVQNRSVFSTEKQK